MVSQRRDTVTGLFIPADVNEPVREVEIGSRQDVSDLVGGIPESTQYDHDCTFWVDDVGRTDGLPMNTRATEYIKTESLAARRGRAGAMDPSYGLYGPVVVTGPDLTQVPDRLVERFAPEIAHDIGDSGGLDY